MGAKTWMLVSSNKPAHEVLKSNPVLDRTKSKELAVKLFPEEIMEPLEDGSLGHTSPSDDELFIGCYDDLVVVAAKEFAIDFPSQCPIAILTTLDGKYMYLHAMHSVVDWFGFAVWENSKLVRALSLAQDGPLEDVGDRLAFENPYWAGEHSELEPDEEDDENPYPFHPLSLGEAALGGLFGYVLEGYQDPDHIEPEEFPLLAFKRIRLSAEIKPWWKFW